MVINNLEWDIASSILLVIITGVGLVIAIRTLTHNGRIAEKTANSLEYNVIKGTFDSIQESEKELNLLLNKKNQTEEQIEQWCSLYFNKLEFFSYMVNLGYINMNHAKFFENIIIDGYNKKYKKYCADELNDANVHENFKKLYKRLISNKNR